MAAYMDKMNELMKKKDEIEAEIKALNDVLDSQQSIGMDGPLVDTEQFPRADIDIYSVRHARHQIIRLQNDHVELMSEIEEELYRIHAEARQNDPSLGHRDPSPASVQGTTTTQPSTHLGTINSIDKGSPAEQAGLKVGDAVIQFGSLTYDNFKGLQNIASIVQHSIDKSISLIVRRNEALEICLSIIPSRWQQNKGLLGCNILPNVKTNS